MALIQCNFFSRTLGMASSMDVILPETLRGQMQGQDDDVLSRGWPCLFLLHGLSDDHTVWRRRTAIERYVSALGLAVVMPNVHRSFYTDMVNGYPYWTFISEELPAKARSFFPLSARREDNFVAGLSMGGYGALKLALSFPDRYAAAASLSGGVDPASLRRRDLAVSALVRDYELVFGADADIEGSPDDLKFLAEELSGYSGSVPLLYQCCGTEDYLYQENEAFRDHVRGLGLDLTYEEGPGAHEWAYWDAQIQRVLAWLPLRRD